MGVREFKSFPNLPIIGQPKVIEWRPVIVCVCSCGEGDPILITSTDRAPKCSGCGRLYALAELHYNAGGDGADVGIMEVRPPAGNGQPM